MLQSKDRPTPAPTYMDHDQMGQHFPKSPFVLPHTPARSSRLRECLIADELGSQLPCAAQYLSSLRQTRPARPSGARPPPSSRFGGLKRAETDIADNKETVDDRPHIPTSNSIPPVSGSEPKLSHRRTDSNLSRRSLCSSSSPFAGRPLARAPSASPMEPCAGEDPEQQSIRHTPSMSYMERGTRWMEKQEAKSLRLALEDMDLEEERKVHAAAQDEAAELVWKHRNPEAASTHKVFSNPDLAKDYRAHLRRGSYQRSQGVDVVGGQRSASDSSQGSNNPSSSTKHANGDGTRKVSPPTGTVSISKRRESNTKSYNHLAEAVANDIAAAHRRTSSGNRRILSGEKKMFMHPNDRIWEDPQEDQPPPRKPAVVEERRETQPSVQQMPSLVRKNPFARVRAHQEKMERSNSTPTISTLRPAQSLRHDRVEIQRNEPSQSRNPWYMSNEPLPPTPANATDYEADEVAPKTTPSKDGKEIRGDDIRAATSKTRMDYSPNLPRPTVVSDKPGRPIVSFQKDWRPTEVVMEEKPSAGVGSAPPTMKKSFTFPRMPAPESSSSPIPRISIDDNDGPQIPTINLPDDPVVPAIVLPEDPDSTVPTIVAPTIDVSGPTDTGSPTKNGMPYRPLPSTRPPPRHAATAPVASAKSSPHYTPSIRQSGALCAHCALPIAGRILSAAGQRFHPGCFVCHECNTNLECVAFYPEPERQRADRVNRIRARHGGMEAPGTDGMTPDQVSAQTADDGDETLRFYCHLDFHELFSPRCKSCKTPIEGEVIVACGAEWHVGHFFCAQCGDPFDSTMPFVEKDGYAWCVACHTNRYSSKCRKCKKPVTDVVVKALGSDWHGGCFVCTECNGEFEDGRYFIRGDSHDPVCVKCEERRLKA